MKRGLSNREARKVAGELATPAGRARVRASAPAAVAGREGWTWGRQIHAPELATIAKPAARVAVVCTIERTLYRAAKGKRAGVNTWQHDHAQPFALLVRPARPSERSRTARGLTLPRRDVFRLGEAVSIEGHDRHGRPVAVTFRRGVALVAEPHTARMMLAGARLWVLPNGSPCRVTPDGLVR